LGVGLIPGVGWRASEITTVAREAEDAGFDAIFTAEVNNDALATAQLMGAATRQVKVGTWIASIHMRHSYACAKAAELTADATGGRMILGLGMSHRPVDAALGAEMPSPVAALRHYATEVAGWLRGEGPTTHLPQQSAPVPVPIYLATMTSPTVELAGELADGMMPFMWSAMRVTRSKAWAARGRAKAPGRASRHRARDLCRRRHRGAARRGTRQPRLVYDLPVLSTDVSRQRLCRGGGEGGSGRRLRLAERPYARCDLFDRPDFTLQRTARGFSRRVDLPILSPPIGVDGAREVIRAFRR